MSAKSWKKSRRDLLEELDELYEELIEANEAYDKGKVTKGKRISSTLCKLFHDGNGRSLTTQLGLRKQMCFPDGLHAKEGLKRVGLPLCVLHIPQGASDFFYQPICVHEALRDLPVSPFPAWWGGEVVAAGSGRLTRGQLVKIMRNKEADHIDYEIKEGPYVSMKTHDDLFIKVFECEDGMRKIEAFGASFYFSPYLPSNRSLSPVVTGPCCVPGAEFATMRQIGWEAEMALGSAIAILRAKGE